DDESFRRLVVEEIERFVQFDKHRRRQCIGRRAGLVEHESREAVGFAGELPVFHHPRSTSIAPPSPPPMQIAAMPRRPPILSSTFSTWSAIRAPDAPTGWPIAIAPPSTLSLASLMGPG